MVVVKISFATFLICKDKKKNDFNILIWMIFNAIC